MQTSPTIGKIAAALLSAQKEMDTATKDSNNPFFKSKYADINAIREACIPSLNKYGISVIQPTTYIDGKNFVNTVFLHESGEFLGSLTEILYQKAGDAQGQGSGITYARRYGLQSMANVGCEDDDGNTASRPKTVAEPTTAEKAANMVKTPAKTLTINELEELRDSLRLVNDVSELGKFFNQLPKDTQTDKGALALLGARKAELNKLQLA